MDANPYKTLGVDPKANQEEIKAAYRKLAKKFHPDLNPGNKTSESRFKEITSAYDQIGSSEDRAKFDRGELEAEAAARRPRGPFYSETQYEGGRYANQFEGMDNDILNSILEQMQHSGQSGSRRTPENKVYQLDIDFTESILGGDHEIVLPNGKKFLAKIPAGVESGTKLRFAGKGDPGKPGGPPGDVYVQLHVNPSSVFRRVGRDLEIDLPVSLSDAILGAEVKVPTIDGSILMKIPPHVNSDQKLRIKGKGVPDPKTKSRGDQIAILKIKMPENIDQEFRKAVEDWTKRQPKESV